MEGGGERKGASGALFEEGARREARGCRERCAQKAKEKEQGKSIPHL